ncbi:MAG: ArsR/SmtB family transcription factor [Thermodesulfobacteriota bacterium]
MKTFIKTMKALSDPNRVKIVKMLQHRSMCVCEIQAALGIAQPTASKHLKLLEEAGFIGFRKEGLWVNYYLETGADSPYVAVLQGNLRHWLNDDAQVQALMEKLPAIDRRTLCGG